MPIPNPDQNKPDPVNTTVASLIRFTMWVLFTMFNAAPDLTYEQKLWFDLGFFGPLQLLAAKVQNELRK